MSELDDFVQAVEAALAFARRDGRTLVVFTADHSTGGLTVGKGGIDQWEPTPIQRAKRTPEWLAEKIVSGAGSSGSLFYVFCYN